MGRDKLGKVMENVTSPQRHDAFSVVVAILGVEWKDQQGIEHVDVRSN
jgi:hypothetical protein